jgi:acetyltransferase EpsM
MSEIILIGVGDQVKVIIAAAQLSGAVVRAIYDDDASRWGKTLFGVPIIGPVSQAESAGLPAVLGFDDPHERKAHANRLDLRWVTVIHPRAFFDQSAEIGPGTVVLEGVVVQADAVIRRHVVVSANVTISHDSFVHDYAHLRPGVVLAGTVEIGEGACLEIGALVIPNVRVGAWTRIGPRAVVIRDVPDNAHLAGLPAEPIDDH